MASLIVRFLRSTCPIRPWMIGFGQAMIDALDRQNFLGYALESNCGTNVGEYCGLNINTVDDIPETRVTQMPLFPVLGSTMPSRAGTGGNRFEFEPIDRFRPAHPLFDCE
jgi:hypothetical protein